MQIGNEKKSHNVEKYYLFLSLLIDILGCSKKYNVQTQPRNMSWHLVRKIISLPGAGSATPKKYRRQRGWKLRSSYALRHKACYLSGQQFTMPLTAFNSSSSHGLLNHDTFYSRIKRRFPLLPGRDDSHGQLM